MLDGFWNRVGMNARTLLVIVAAIVGGCAAIIGLALALAWLFG